MSDGDFEDFCKMVRQGGLHDCPPEIGAELQRGLRIIKETFARHGVTNFDDAPLDIQKAIEKELNKAIKKPGPKRPELRPGQFYRDLYLTYHIDYRNGKIEAAFQDVAADLGETESWVRKRYYELRSDQIEWLGKTSREAAEEWFEDHSNRKRDR